jgi:uncharacterized integral membrane protein
MDNEKKDANTLPTTSSRDAVVRRIRVLWVALVVYFLIMLNAFRYVYVAPYQAVIAGSIVNMAIIVSLVLALKRAYKSLAK